MSPTEQPYAQIEKEALGITWASECFTDYLIGPEFHIETDHKPFVPLLRSHLQHTRLMCEQRPNLSHSSSEFVLGGCVNFPLDSLRSHAGSVGHQRAADAIRIAANPQEAVTPRALRQLNKEVVSKLEKLFDIAYFVTKIEMPFTMYSHLCLQEEKHAVDLGQTYRNDKACK